MPSLHQFSDVLHRVSTALCLALIKSGDICSPYETGAPLKPTGCMCVTCIVSSHHKLQTVVLHQCQVQ